MKEITLTPKEYMLMRELALKYNYLFEHKYSKDKKIVTVKIAEEFCEAFGF